MNAFQSTAFGSSSNFIIIFCCQKHFEMFGDQKLENRQSRVPVVVESCRYQPNQLYETRKNVLQFCNKFAMHFFALYIGKEK